MIKSISAGEYFEDDIPALVINDGSNISNAICTFMQSLKTSSMVRYRFVISNEAILLCILFGV